MAENKDVSTMRVGSKVWKNGTMVNWEDAHIHVMSHVVHYGSSVFEGIDAMLTRTAQRSFVWMSIPNVFLTLQRSIA